MDETSQPLVYEFGDFRLDLRHHLLSDGRGVPVLLSPRAFDLLVYFAEHHGELLDKSTLMKAVWPNVIVEDNNLSQHLSALRRALGDGQQGRRYIVTIPRRGYRFVADVRRASGSATTAVGRDASFAEDRSLAEDADSSATASVAVLPFANVSGDPQVEYFADGMAEEVIYRLARVPGLKVPARTSSFAYKGKSLNVRAIARDLGVETVLEGSVRSAGERIRITAQLISAETGYHIWSQSFDRDFRDVFLLQDEIACAIVGSLKDHMNAPLGAPPAPAAPTRDLYAYELFLQGISIGRRGGEAHVLRGLELLEKAVSLDPGFARACAEIAALRTALIFYGRPESIDQTRREAERALALDPTLAGAYSALGIVDVVRREWLEAQTHFSIAARYPGDRNAPGYYYAAYLSAAVGHIRKTVATLKEEYRAAPASPVVPALLAAATLALPLRDGVTSDALRYADLAADLGVPKHAGPMPAVYLYAALRLRRKEDAANAAELFVHRLRAPLLATGGADAIRLVLADLADPRGTRAAVPALDKLVVSVPTGEIGPEFSVHIIAWYMMLGTLDRAYDFANRLVDHSERSNTMGIFLNWLWLPELLPFRRDERFRHLAERLNLTKYWAEYGPPDD